MLVLTRCIGETIHIGDEICVTVYDKMIHHVTLGVIASPVAGVQYGTTRLKPVSLPGERCFYLVSLLSEERLQIGDAEIKVRFVPSALQPLGLRAQQIRIAIKAAREIPVYREEIYRRVLHERGQPVPPVLMSEWLLQANQSVSRCAVA